MKFDKDQPITEQFIFQMMNNESDFDNNLNHTFKRECTNFCMSMDDFISCVKEKMEEKLSDGEEVVIKEMVKNNNVHVVGLSILAKDVNISPVIYLEMLYEAYKDGTPFDEIVEQVWACYEKCRMNQSMSMDFFLDFGNARKRICYKLINYEKNQNLLKEVPHRKYLDLAVVYYYFLENEGFESATILIRNEHLKEWEQTEEELFRAAKTNTTKLLQNDILHISEILSEFGTESFAEENSIRESSMYICSNRARTFGATALMEPELLKEFAEQKGKNFFILPSSIHELIFLPFDCEEDFEDTADKYACMVRNVNETQLEEQEILSDHVYFYTAQKNQVTCIGQ